MVRGITTPIRLSSREASRPASREASRPASREASRPASREDNKKIIALQVKDENTVQKMSSDKPRSRSKQKKSKVRAR